MKTICTEMKKNGRERLTPEDLLVLCLLSVGDHVLNGGGGVAAQLSEAHGQPSSLPSHCIVLATGASSEILYFTISDPDPHESASTLGSTGPGSVLEMWIRIRIQEQENLPKLEINLTFQHDFCTYVGIFFDILPIKIKKLFFKFLNPTFSDGKA